MLRRPIRLDAAHRASQTVRSLEVCFVCGAQMTIRKLFARTDTRPEGLAWRQTTGAISLAQYQAALGRIRRHLERAPLYLKITAPNTR